MYELLADPLILVIFVMIALPMLALSQMFSGEKKISDRLLNRQDVAAKTDSRRQSAADLAYKIDVRKELPVSKFGILGTSIDSLVNRNEAIGLKILQSGIKYSFADIFLINFLLLGLCLTISLGVLQLPLLLTLAGCIILFVIAPYAYLTNTIKSRQKRFLADFPDALDLVVRGIRSGLPVVEAIETISQDFGGPIGETFSSVQAKVAIGQTLDEALWETSVQIPLPEFRFFIISLTIQQETGGNLGEILSKLSNLIRQRHQLKLKVKALSSEARASAYILGVLPFLMMGIIYSLNPDYITVLFTDPRGNLMLGIGAVMLTLGFVIMSKMSKFNI